MTGEAGTGSNEVRSVLRLETEPGRKAELVAYFADRQILDEAVSRGCLRTELWEPGAASDHVLVCADWRTRDDYERWLQEPIRHEWTAVIGSCTISVSSTVYDVALEAQAGSAGECQ